MGEAVWYVTDAVDEEAVLRSAFRAAAAGHGDQRVTWPDEPRKSDVVYREER